MKDKILTFASFIKFSNCCAKIKDKEYTLQKLDEQCKKHSEGISFNLKQLDNYFIQLLKILWQVNKKYYRCYNLVIMQPNN